MTDIDVLIAIANAHRAAWAQLSDAMQALVEDSDPLELRWFDKWAGSEAREQPYGVVAANWNYDVELGDLTPHDTPPHEASYERRNRERKNQVREILAQFDWAGVDADEPHRATTFGDLLERCGAEIDWCDQVGECDSCNGALKTEPNHYGWLPQYFDDHEGNITCRWCLEDDPSEYLEWLEGNPKRALTLGIDLTEHGYKKLEQDFETGMHRGQDDSLELAAERLEALGVSRFIFEITDKGQFDMHWCVWIHEDEWECLKGTEELEVTGPLISAAMERGLREASLQSDALRQAQAETGGIIVSKVGMDGVTTRLISREDFIDGKALEDEK